MRIIGIFLSLLAASMLGTLDVAEAAKKKSATTAPEKPIYEAPMRVVIVRSSDPKCEPKCPQWIDAEGEIKESTPQAFRKVFKQMGKAKLPIIIRSPGGSIEAALSIGRMVRERGLTVAVGYTRFTGCSPAAPACKLPPENNGVYSGVIEEAQAFCNSACPMLLAGGTTRMASYLAYVGVHQPRTTWTRQNIRYREFYRIVKGKKKVISRTIISRKTVPDKVTFGLSKRLRKTLTRYYSSMGVDLAILDETMKASFDNMNYLTPQQNDKLKIRTSPLLAKQLGFAALCGTTATSAQCVEDKARDPAKLAILALKAVGVDHDAAKMSFRLARLKDAPCTLSCPTWISADGNIVSETPADFEVFLKQHKLPAVAVVFNSAGGDAAAALQLGRMIRNAGFETSFGQTRFSDAATTQTSAQAAEISATGSCNGACVMAYAGGRQRHSNAQSRVLLHNPQSYKTPALPWLATSINLYFIEIGVRPQMMSDMYNIKGKEGFQLKRHELLTYTLSTDAQNVEDLLSATKCENRLWAVSCVAFDVAP
jgi:hypothetical protein